MLKIIPKKIQFILRFLNYNVTSSGAFKFGYNCKYEYVTIV